MEQINYEDENKKKVNYYKLNEKLPNAPLASNYYPKESPYIT